jgi:uroporphyrinogen III methyltransferase/synthase
VKRERRLTGRRILITRPEQQAGELAEALSALGASSLFLPGLDIGPPESFGSLDAALERLDEFDWIVFTSQNAVAPFVGRMKSKGRGGSPRASIAAVGPTTAKALAAHSVAVDLMAEEAVAESLAAGLAKHVRGRRVLLPRAEEARELLPDELRRAGAAEVCVVSAYRSAPSSSASAATIAQQLSEGAVDAVTFASARTVSAVIARLRVALGDRTLELLARCRVFSIGPLTTRACLDEGLSQVTEANPHTLEGMVTAILRELGVDERSPR